MTLKRKNSKETKLTSDDKALLKDVIRNIKSFNSDNITNTEFILLSLHVSTIAKYY